MIKNSLLRVRHRIGMATVALGALLLVLWASHRSPVEIHVPQRTSDPQAAAASLRLTVFSTERNSGIHPLERGENPSTPGEKNRDPFHLSAGEDPSDQSLPSPSSRAIVTVAGESLLATLENEIRQKGDAFGYNSRHYGATLESGWIEYASPSRLRDIGSPRLTYALERVSVGDEVVAVGGRVDSHLDTESRTVRYSRGSVDESYVLRKEALEQTFLIKSLPERRGDITVLGRIDTNLEPPVPNVDATALAFSHQGIEVVSISEAVAMDAGGRRLPLPLSYRDGRVSLTVPADWVRTASLPIQIDPLIGPPVQVLSTSRQNTNYSVDYFNVRTCDAAYSSLSQTWFVVWTEKFGASTWDYDIRGQKVSASGTLVGGPVGIVTTSAGSYEPTIAVGRTTNNANQPIDRYLIAWRHDPTADGGVSDQNIYGKIYDQDGVFVTLNPFPISNLSGQDLAPTAAYDGSRFYVSWTNRISSTHYGVRGQFVTPSGTVPNLNVTYDPAVVPVIAGGSSVAFTNGVYLIAWEEGTMSSRSLRARSMRPDGTFPGPAVEIEPPANSPREVDVAGGGSQFLIVWRRTSNDHIKARIATASPGNPVSFAGPAFDAVGGNASRQTPRAAYSTTDTAWLVAYRDDATGGGDIFGTQVSTSGVPSTPFRISSASTDEWRPELAWNSLTNEFLVIYRKDPATSLLILGQRVSLSGPPAAPTNLAAVPGNGSVSLSWTGSPGATTYTLMRGTTPGGPYLFSVPGLTSTSYVDSGLTNGNTYVYVVTAVGPHGESEASNEASATPVAPPPPMISRVSVAADGGTLGLDSLYSAVSADGRFVAYLNQPLLFIRDTVAGINRVVPNAIDMTEKNKPSISDDGRFVAYSRLIGSLNQVCVFDLQTSTEEIVSVNPSGAPGNSHSYSPSISADGRTVVFHGDATDLVAGDTNGHSDVFVRDRQLATTRRISVSTGGAEGDADSTYATVSGDGHVIAFWSRADNLVPGDDNFAADIFIYDQQAGTLERIDSFATQERPAVSFDGRIIAYSASTTDLVPTTNLKNDVYWYDRQTATKREILAPGGVLANDHSWSPSISGDGRYIAYYSDATNLVSGDINNVQDVFVYDTQTATIARASVSAAGIQGNGASQYPSISRNGQWIAFHSAATNLIPGDTNGVIDVFLAPNPPPSRLPGTTLAFSVSPVDTQAGAPITPAVRVQILDSAGTVVEVATNPITIQLGANPASGVLSGTLTVNASGGEAVFPNLSINAPGTGYSLLATSPGLSPGTSTLFNVLGIPIAHHLAFGLAPSLREEQGVTFCTFTVEVRDASDHLLPSDSSTQVSLSSGTGFLSGTLTRPVKNGIAVFDDLRYGAVGTFTFGVSTSSGLSLSGPAPVIDVQAGPASGAAIRRASLSTGGAQLTGDTQFSAMSTDGRFVAYLHQPSLFVRDVLLGTVQQIPNQVDQTEFNKPSLSGNGRFVAYSRLAGGINQVFVYDLQNSVEELVSTGPAGVPGNSHSYAPSMSTNAQFISFHADATNLVPGDTNAHTDVFLRDRVAGTTRRVSMTPGGTEANHDSNYSSISADGRFVAFQSRADNLVPGDSNGAIDVFVFDRLTAALQRIDAFSTVERPAISAGGRFVAYTANTSDALPLSNNKNDVYIFDRGTSTKLEILAPGGVLANGHSWTPTISDDGRYVAFSSEATNLVTGDLNNAQDIFIYDAFTGAISRASVNVTGVQGDGPSLYPAISGSGRFLSFQSASTALVAGDSNGALDVFVAPNPPPVLPPATQLAFSVQPTNTLSGATLVPSVRVQVRDSSGTLVGIASNSITLQLGSSPPGAVLSGALTINASAGEAVFPNLSINLAGGGYTLQATSPGLSSATSAPFDILPPPPPHHLAFGIPPSVREQAGVTFSAFTVEVRDAFDQLIRSDQTTQITLLIASGGGTLAGTVTRTVVGGVAVFEDITYGQGQPFTLTAISDGPASLAGSGAVIDVQSGPLSGASIFRANVGTGGTELTGDTQYSAISADGRYVAYLHQPSLFVRDTITGTIQQIPNQVDQTDVNKPSLSDNGRFVAYARLIGAQSQVCVYDLQANVETVLSVTPAGVNGNSQSYAASISGDGRLVAFHSDSSNLVPGDTNAHTDVFVRDRLTGTTQRISLGPSGVEGNHDSNYPAISGNGRFVAFQSRASNLVPGDVNGGIDVFISDLQTGLLERIDALSTVERPAISSDGRFIAFTANTSDILSPTNSKNDVYLFDRQTAIKQEISMGLGGVLANNHSWTPAISGDGRYVAFSSDATNLISGDANNARDIFIFDAQTSTLQRASVTSAGTEANGVSEVPAFSRDGRFVSFHSSGANLISGDTNASIDIFVAPRP